ncbi:MAG: fumarate reductase cytochrome b subunit, partial [Wenzhouxiangellaceae bacterium]
MSASRFPARLDVLQGASGLFLALFMWLHMFFVSSILLGKDAFWHVARFFEGYHVFGKPYPILVTLIAGLVFAILIFHAALALRKFPSDWKQYSSFRQHARDMKHGDTTLWFVQVWTGFAMFFLASIHLYTMMTQPETIGPYGS